VRKLMSIVLAIFAVPLFAQDPPPVSTEEKDLAELLSILQEETEVATKTRMNSDYVPGIVTVLHGDELEALGIATAWEALGLVPGIQAVRDPRSNPSTIVRGIDFPFNSGNIQILINGIPLTREDSGINAAALLVPVEQIDRIEVIRGPGSVVYGNFAFMGLVNVITRDEGTRVFGRFESDVSLKAGARIGWKSDRGPWKASVSLSRYTSDDAPSQISETDEDRMFGVFGLARGGFSVTAQFVDRDWDGRRRGTANSFYDEESWAVEGRYRRELRPKLQTTARLTYLSNDLGHFTTAMTGDLLKGGVDAVWDGFARQSWLASAEISRSTIDEAFFAPARPGQPPVRTLLARDKERTVTGLTLQDTISVRDNVSLTLGARHDSYSDLDDRVTPRVALVWRATDQHILKAQYAEGYRPPTFFELYSPPIAGARYPFEVNATTEINYVYRVAGRVGRATVFRSELTDMIRPGGVVTAGTTKADGVELEWTQQLTEAVKIDANVTMLDTEDARTGFQPNLVSAEWLGNVALFVRPIANTFAGVRWNAVGGRRNGEDFHTIDLTVSRQDLVVAGLDVRGGIKNALDDEVTYLTALPNGTVNTTLFPGRTWWLQLSWKR
jgi:outer membrane receptor for ferrienterochelin and colicins